MSDIFQNDLRKMAGVNPSSKKANAIGAVELMQSALTKIADFRVGLRIKDEQQAVRRYEWTGLPKELSPQLIERILYYRGQGALFKFNEKYYFLPYTLSGEAGTIDAYGRYNSITPMVFNGSADNDKGAKPLLKGLSYKVIKDMSEDVEDAERSAVILWDYTPQASQQNVPRYKLQDTLINGMSENIVLSRSAILASMPAETLLCQDEGQVDSIRAEVQAIEYSILTGQRIIPISSPLTTEPITSSKGGSTIVQDVWQNYESLDCLRLSNLGIDNEGVFQKKSQKLASESDVDSANVAYVYEDGLACRREFAEIANKVFGLNIKVNESEVLEEMTEDTDNAVEEENMNEEVVNNDNAE